MSWTLCRPSDDSHNGDWMTKKKRSAWIWRSVIIILIVISAFLLHYTHVERVAQGYFTADPLVITVNTISGWLLFALLTGFVVAELLSKAKKR